MTLYAEQRQQRILTRAQDEGRVEVASLATEFDVTQETIRRDLDRLERQGLLRRVHGGAIPANHLGFEPGLSQRDALASSQKSRIARAGASLLPKQGTVLIDAGTSTARLATALSDDCELTVVTNALPIATALASRPAMTVHLVGGRVRGRTLATVDTWALQVLAGLNVDVAVLGTNGISVERGLTTPDLAEAGVKAAMVAAGQKVIVLADSSKVGHDQFARFADLDEVDTVITDGGMTPTDRDAISGAGPEVVVA
jgi:DeoR family transcriptional regulator, fructose operon transcriptional repressor